MASHVGQTEVVKLLLGLEVDVDAVNEVCMYAALCKMLHCVK